jgi:hypothetical protein
MVYSTAVSWRKISFRTDTRTPDVLNRRYNTFLNFTAHYMLRWHNSIRPQPVLTKPHHISQLTNVSHIILPPSVRPLQPSHCITPKRVFAACTVHSKCYNNQIWKPTKQTQNTGFGNHRLRGQYLLPLIRHQVVIRFIRPYHGSGGQSLFCHHGDPGSIPGQCLWDLWLDKLAVG